MICVLQRVSRAEVRVEERIVGQIGLGILALVAIHQSDVPEDVAWMARKIAGLRMFPREDRNFDLDVKEAGGSILLVSNFTVAADARSGRRPSLAAAAEPAAGKILFDELIAAVRDTGVDVQIGQFGAHMEIALTNDGPVTFLLDSRKNQDENR
jgi:D-tyrosyl-tRNA(Tyr) deacylase